MAAYIPKDPLVWRIVHRVPESVGCLLLLLWVPLVTPLVPLFVWRQQRRRAWLAKHLASRGRHLTWAEFAMQANTHGGTIIVEVGNKFPARFWWAADRVRDGAPMPPPLLSPENFVAFGGAEYPPFARWCYENYLAPDTGKALLVYPHEDDSREPPFRAEYEQHLRELFPNQDLIILAYYDTRYA